LQFISPSGAALDIDCILSSIDDDFAGRRSVAAYIEQLQLLVRLISAAQSIIAFQHAIDCYGIWHGEFSSNQFELASGRRQKLIVLSNYHLNMGFCNKHNIHSDATMEVCENTRSMVNHSTVRSFGTGKVARLVEF
jgi:hypothetical protein